MCLISKFFPLLALYFVSLVLTTVVRKQITYKGIFYVFTTFLSLFVFFLMYIFTDVLLNSSTSEFSLVFNANN